MAAGVRDQQDQALADPVKKKGIAAGVAIAALYVVVAQLSFRGGLVPWRTLYDGYTPPQKYRWVNPPSDLKHGNTPPTPATGTFKIGPKHSPPYNLNTDDTLVSVIFPPDGIVPMAGQTSVRVDIKPLDPAKVATPPPGYQYDGNAYSITATYLPSGKPAVIPKAICDLNNANACATVILRYAFSATKLYLLNGQTWTEAKSQLATAALQIYGITDQLGTFVAADVAGTSQKTKGQTGNIIAFVVGVAAILLGTFVARLRASRKRRAREAARQKKGPKQAPPKPKSKPKKPGKAERQQRKEESEDKPWWRD